MLLAQALNQQPSTSDPNPSVPASAATALIRHSKEINLKRWCLLIEEWCMGKLSEISKSRIFEAINVQPDLGPGEKQELFRHGFTIQKEKA